METLICVSKEYWNSEFIFDYLKDENLYNLGLNAFRYLKLRVEKDIEGCASFKAAGVFEEGYNPEGKLGMVDVVTGIPAASLFHWRVNLGTPREKSKISN